jgi:hypothetical protein
MIVCFLSQKCACPAATYVHAHHGVDGGKSNKREKSYIDTNLRNWHCSNIVHCYPFHHVIYTAALPAVLRVYCLGCDQAKPSTPAYCAWATPSACCPRYARQVVVLYRRRPTSSGASRQQPASVCRTSRELRLPIESVHSPAIVVAGRVIALLFAPVLSPTPRTFELRYLCLLAVRHALTRGLRCVAWHGVAWGGMVCRYRCPRVVWLCLGRHSATATPS